MLPSKLRYSALVCCSMHEGIIPASFCFEYPFIYSKKYCGTSCFQLCRLAGDRQIFACKSVTKHSNMPCVFLSVVKNFIDPLQENTELQSCLPWLINISSSNIHIFALFPLPFFVCKSFISSLDQSTVFLKTFWMAVKLNRWWCPSNAYYSTEVTKMWMAMSKLVRALLVKSPLWLPPGSPWL